MVLVVGKRTALVRKAGKEVSVGAGVRGVEGVEGVERSSYAFMKFSMQSSLKDTRRQGGMACLHF